MQTATHVIPNLMKPLLSLCGLILLVASAGASVRVYVEEVGGKAWIKYHCTAGEIVRAFALDVTVNAGQITHVSEFFRGENTSTTRGYGFFPTSFRNHITVTSGTNINWNITAYTPLAAPTDRPAGTQPGLNSSGVTLEFGALWNPDIPAAIPTASGVLCALQLSQPALVSIAENRDRGGVVSATTGNTIGTIFNAAYVDPSAIVTGIVLTNGVVKITFKGGELETASATIGPWTSTGNSSGNYSAPVEQETAKFFRVRRL